MALLALLKIIANSDQCHDLEFNYNREAMPVGGARPLIDLKVAFGEDC